jgi:hypothetical protein
MADIIHFTPKGKKPADNLNDFIDHCKNNLTIYEAQGGFGVNKWKTSGKKTIAMQFGVYKGSVAQYEFQPFSEPFLSFAKAYVRYIQSIKESQSITTTMVGLQVIYDVLIEIHDAPNALKIDGLVQKRVVEILNERYPCSDRLYRYGGALARIYKLVKQKEIHPSLPDWKNPWKRGRSKADRTDKESRQWQDERCPSQHQMLALADCFNRAESKEDQYWSSVLTLLMFAPGRGGELSELTIGCIGEEDGQHFVRWESAKGFGATVKWIPEQMVGPVYAACNRLEEISRPAREAAKFAYENPGVFMRHEGCITPEVFPENARLSALEFYTAVNIKKSAEQIQKNKWNPDSASAWGQVANVKWVQKIRKAGDITYQRLAQFIAEKYQDRNWPYLGQTDRYVWESLVLVRDQEFHNQFGQKPFSWEIPSVNRLNDQLNTRQTKYPLPTIFQRFGIKDENGSEIQLSSHQLRVWLSTNAERGGMDSWQLAQWAGRSRIQDNRHYDLRTRHERNEQAKEILTLTQRPNALQSIKLNLPVAYADLGINRIGVAEVTLYGMCTHDYAMSPCTKSGECMTCKEHVCIKGMPKTLGRMKQLEAMVASQLEKAKEDANSGAFGADRWVTHLVWKLAHITTQIKRLESDDVSEGAVLWIPPEHDPSPVKRALQEQGFDSGTGASSPDVDSIKQLLEL